VCRIHRPGDGIGEDCRWVAFNFLKFGGGFCGLADGAFDDGLAKTAKRLVDLGQERMGFEIARTCLRRRFGAVSPDPPEQSVLACAC
jgi:hypothetical protein